MQTIAPSPLYGRVNWLSLRAVLLFRPPGPAAAGRVGLYFAAGLYFFYFFFARTYRWESAHRAPADTIPAVKPPHPLLKYRQTSDQCCPPFLQGSKMWQILAQISTPVVFGPPYFWTGALYRKTKTNLSPIGAVADVKRLPCHISQFAPYISQGGKN